MLKHPDLTVTRIEKFLQKQLKPLLFPDELPLTIAAFEVHGEPIPPAEAFQASYQPFAREDSWGSLWGTTWFRFEGTIPPEWKGQPVSAKISIGGGGAGYRAGEGFTREALIFREGKPAGAFNVHRDEFRLTDHAHGGEKVTFYVEAAANPKVDGSGQTSELGLPDPEQRGLYQMGHVYLSRRDPVAWDLVFDFESLLQVMKEQSAGSLRRGQLLATLNEAILAFRENDRRTWKEARKILQPQLSRRNSETVYKLSAIGHAHIDTAWLWPLRETIRKCARTFSTALAYMEDYPEYVFGCSQAIQYAWMKQHYPTIFEGIRAAVRRGQWEPIGSSWIEADCNIPSGESLVRQIVHGKRFFEKELGYTTRDMWIPDVFGYSASFPQILKLSEIDYFLTQKISWNDTNRFPHHSFYWEGIDGTRVFTHFPPNDTYNSGMLAFEIAGSEKKFLESDRATRAMFVYGYGDGGGGPTREMLERARRFHDIEGLPQVSLQKAIDFFPLAEEELKHPSVWVGELYLEKHRGTYTTQGRTKKASRDGERLLREAEAADAMSFALGLDDALDRPSVLTNEPERAVYDIDLQTEKSIRNGRLAALDRAWKLLLLNQFHDIIPGSSIHWVYLDNLRDAEVFQELASRVREDGLACLATQLGNNGAQEPLLVFNPLGWSRREVISDLQGAPMMVDVPACGVGVVDAEEGRKAADLLDEEERVQITREHDQIILENGTLRVMINRHGEITSLVEKTAEREALAEGEVGNVLQLFDDRPNHYDAWEIELFSLENYETVSGADSIEVIEDHPLRSRVKVVRRFGQSRMEQTIQLCAGANRVDFFTEIDWHEKHTMLKVAFPLAVRSSRATYEIQYGHVERPTHINTSWDQARFEVCAQKWADLSEPGFGVALLNDGKYGHDCRDHILRLTLLRSPTAPDPKADEGKHSFTYSLLPHEYDCREGGVIEDAYALNYPLHVRAFAGESEGADAHLSFVEVLREGLVLEAVKVADEGRAVIVRLYEAYGSRGEGEVRLNFPHKAVHFANLLEKPQDRVEPTDDFHYAFPIRPFQIITLRIDV